GGQQVTQIDHARLGIRRIAAVGEAAGELGELVVGVACGARVAFGQVQRDEAGDQAAILVEGSQALEVIGIVDAGVLGMQANKALGGGAGGFRLKVLVVGVDQFELGLLGVAAEGIA